MVVDEVVESNGFVDPARAELTIQSVGDFEVVPVVVRGPEAFVYLVVRGRIERPRAAELAVVAMNHLTDEPEARSALSAKSGEVLHEATIQAVRRVETKPIDAQTIDPVAHSVEEVSEDLPVCQVELDQVVVAVPAAIDEGITEGALAFETQPVEPGSIARVPTVTADVLKGPERAAYMVKDRIEDHADPAGV